MRFEFCLSTSSVNESPKERSVRCAIILQRTRCWVSEMILGTMHRIGWFGLVNGLQQVQQIIDHRSLKVMDAESLPWQCLLVKPVEMKSSPATVRTSLAGFHYVCCNVKPYCN